MNAVKNQLEENFRISSDLIYDFVTKIKTELVLNRNFFIFHTVPELIIKNRYAKKKENYDIVINFLKQVRDGFLLNKQQKEIAKFIEEGMKKQYMDEEAIEKLTQTAHKQKDISKISITEDDQVDFRFLDDEVRVLENIQEEKMEVIERFERLCKRSLETKIHETIKEAEKNAKNGGSSKISPAMHLKIERAVFARVIDETM